MLERIKGGLSNAYKALLRELLFNPEHVVGPRGQKTHEMANLMLQLPHPHVGIIETGDAERDSVMEKYLQAEAAAYASGELRGDVLAETLSKFWAGITNPNGTVNSNYGWLVFVNRSLPQMMTPWEWVIESLTRDPFTRQAILRFSLPDHQWLGNKDQVCTMHMHFLYRDGELHATTVMRSQDIIYGFPYDVPYFGHLQCQLAIELGFRVGTYTHIVHSIHLYEKHFDLAARLINATL